MKYPDPIPTIPFTKEAYEKLKSEYQRLKKERIEIMERLKVAREMGDLSENGAYKYAKFELGSVGRQLREIKHLLDNGQVNDKKTTTNVVDFGSTVTVQQDTKEFTFIIVSAHESDLTKNKLSMDSPLGQALMGKTIGDKMTISAPIGDISYTILKIS